MKIVTLFRERNVELKTKAMRNRSKVFSFILLMMISVSGLTAQNISDSDNDFKTKRQKRTEVRLAAKEEKIIAQNDKLIKLLESQDLVVTDDGLRFGYKPESGLVNFFSIKDDVLTFQRKGSMTSATGQRMRSGFYKSQGVITDILIHEKGEGVPISATVYYLDQLTLDPMRALIYVFENRIEVRNDDATGVEIRGKLRTSKEANVYEIAQSSVNVLIDSNPFIRN